MDVNWDILFYQPLVWSLWQGLPDTCQQRPLRRLVDAVRPFVVSSTANYVNWNSPRKCKYFAYWLLEDFSRVHGKLLANREVKWTHEEINLPWNTIGRNAHLCCSEKKSFDERTEQTVLVSWLLLISCWQIIGTMIAYSTGKLKINTKWQGDGHYLLFCSTEKNKYAWQ